MQKPARIPLSRVRVIRSVAGSRLHIGKKRVSLPAGHHVNLFDCFLSHAGRVVPYETLSAAMRWRGTAEGFRHCLRQYVLQLRAMLRREDVRAHFAVAEGVGYALCEPAESSSSGRPA